MEIPSKCPKIWVLTLLILLIFTGVFFESSVFSLLEAQEIEANLLLEEIPQLVTLQENTLIPLSNPANPEPEIVRRFSVIITGYSSTPWQTDDSPYITAAGTWVREGIIANNILPFGTRVKIPELFGDQIFVVEDRMSWQKGNYQIDIWFPDYWEAVSFGAKRTYIEVLEG